MSNTHNIIWILGLYVVKKIEVQNFLNGETFNCLSLFDIIILIFELIVLYLK